MAEKYVLTGDLEKCKSYVDYVSDLYRDSNRIIQKLESELVDQKLVFSYYNYEQDILDSMRQEESHKAILWQTMYKEAETKLAKFKNRYCEYDRIISDKDKELDDIKKQLHAKHIELKKLEDTFQTYVEYKEDQYNSLVDRYDQVKDLLEEKQEKNKVGPYQVDTDQEEEEEPKKSKEFFDLKKNAIYYTTNELKYYNRTRGTLNNYIRTVVETKLQLFESNVEASYNNLINNVCAVLKVKKDLLSDKNYLWVENYIIEKVKVLMERINQNSTQAHMNNTIATKLNKNFANNERIKSIQENEIKELSTVYQELLLENDSLKDHISDQANEIGSLKHELNMWRDKIDQVSNVSVHYKNINKKFDKLDLEQIAEKTKTQLIDYFEQEKFKDDKIKILENESDKATILNQNLKNVVETFYTNSEKIDKIDKIVDFKINEEEIIKFTEYNRNKTTSKEKFKHGYEYSSDRISTTNNTRPTTSGSVPNPRRRRQLLDAGRLKSDLSFETIEPNAQSSTTISTRPGTNQGKRNKSLKELLLEQNILNYEKLDKLFNKDSELTLPDTSKDRTASNQSLGIMPQRPNTANAQRYMDIALVNKKLSELERNKFNTMMNIK